jgi:DNA polymerase-3 subunit alpha
VTRKEKIMNAEKKKVEIAHLHLHSSYSQLDAISKIPDIIKRAKEYGHKSIALTDHGTIAGVPEFYNEAKKAGIKPILACEFYMQPDPKRAQEEKNRKNHHLILLAQNANGWENIKKLTSLANENFYYSPRIGYSHLREHNDGIICLTACLKGIVPYNVAEEKYDEAALHAGVLKGIFGDRFYLELQDGGLDIQIKVNEVMRRMAEKMDIKTVGCQDAHYIDRNDVESHEAIWAIRTRDTLDRPVAGFDEENRDKRFRVYYSTREYWLKDGCHMLYEPLTTEKGHQRMSTLTQEEIERSVEIADRCDAVEIKKEMHLPRYEFIPEISLHEENKGCASVGPGGKTGCTHDRSVAYLKRLVREGYELRYKTKWDDRSKEHGDRLNKELDDIESAGIADYFLIVWDIVNWARSKGIATGPGRGSAAGSMVAFCLGITKIEPIRYGLIWERFYNAGRKGSLADIDLDFSKRRREEVIEYIKNRFGEDRVAQMVTFNTLAPRAVLKDVAKLLGKEGLDFDEANAMTKFVHLKAKTIEEALYGSKDGTIPPNDKLKEYEKNNPKLFRIAKMLQGSPKSKGKHAAGVIICDKPFSEGMPLCWDTKEKTLITEWDGETLDSLGYVKMDILGLKTMDVLQETQEEANRRRR